MSAPTTDQLTVTLTITRSPDNKVYHGSQTLVIPSDHLTEYIVQAQKYFDAITSPVEVSKVKQWTQKLEPK